MIIVEKVAIALIWIAVPVTVGVALAFDSRLSYPSTLTRQQTKVDPIIKTARGLN